ncbi:MAG: hypothetical protein KF814_11300 [Nitrospiraceae bacterium]|nr:hypothetical protein [Nitrospiraceae bacterium]
MTDSPVLYLLRRPAAEVTCLLPATAEQGAASLVLLERADAPPSGFSGAVYRLAGSGRSESERSGVTMISYRDLLELIAAHGRTIVL